MRTHCGLSAWATLLLACWGQHLRSAGCFACWSSPLSMRWFCHKVGYCCLIFGKNHCESCVKQIIDMRISSYRVTRCCRYRLLLTVSLCAGSCSSVSVVQKPWLTIQVLWGHTRHLAMFWCWLPPRGAEEQSRCPQESPQLSDTCASPGQRELSADADFCRGSSLELLL